MERDLWRCRLIVGFLIGVFVFHNLFPYLGLRFESCQTMFSGLNTDISEGRNNHLFMPQWSLYDGGVYFHSLNVHLDPGPTLSVQRMYLINFLNTPGQLSLESIRSAVHRLCRSGRAVHLELLPKKGDKLIEKNACANPRFSRNEWWIPVRLFSPRGDDEYQRWMDRGFH